MMLVKCDVCSFHYIHGVHSSIDIRHESQCLQVNAKSREYCHLNIAYNMKKKILEIVMETCGEQEERFYFYIIIRLVQTRYIFVGLKTQTFYYCHRKRQKKLTCVDTRYAQKTETIYVQCFFKDRNKHVHDTSMYVHVSNMVLIAS